MLPTKARAYVNSTLRTCRDELYSLRVLSNPQLEDSQLSRLTSGRFALASLHLTSLCLESSCSICRVQVKIAITIITYRRPSVFLTSLSAHHFSLRLFVFVSTSSARH